VQAVLAGRRPGAAVTASLVRAGAPLEVSITLGERPARRS
jgi:S1-C subfamily serine protease